MYAIKRITNEYDGVTGKRAEKVKIVSCMKKKSDIDDKLKSLKDEMNANKVYFNTLEQEYVGLHKGGSQRFKEANPDGYEDFLKLRKQGVQDFLRFEIETVGQ